MLQRAAMDCEFIDNIFFINRSTNNRVIDNVQLIIILRLFSCIHVLLIFLSNTNNSSSDFLMNKNESLSSIILMECNKAEISFLPSHNIVHKRRYENGIIMNNFSTTNGIECIIPSKFSLTLAMK